MLVKVSDQWLWYRRHEVSSAQLCTQHSCFHQLHTLTSHLHLSPRESWEKSGTVSNTPCSLQHITVPPTKNTFHPLLIERIPICPGAKFQPCFLETEHPALLCLPWEGPHLPPQAPKNATNDWGSRQWRLSFNSWQVLMGGYQDVNWKDGSVWHLGDQEGFRGVRLLDERAFLRHVLTSCNVEYSSRDNVNYYEISDGNDREYSLCTAL